MTVISRGDYCGAAFTLRDGFSRHSSGAATVREPVADGLFPHPACVVLFPNVAGRGQELAIKAHICPVRVHTGGLRSRSAEYYVGEGANNPVRISIPRGNYQ